MGHHHFIVVAIFVFSFIAYSFQTEAAGNCTDIAYDCWCKSNLCRNTAYATLMNRQCCETCTRLNSTAAAAARGTGRRKRLAGFAELVY